MNESRFSSKRLILAALAGAAVLAATMAVASASLAAGPQPLAAPVNPPCKTSGLVIWSNNGAGGGTAGSVFYMLRFSNLSGHICTLMGFPKVTAVNLAGKRIGSAAQHEVGQKPKPKKLANGATATAPLRVVDPGNFSPSACHEVMAAGLRVTPPGQSHSKLIPIPFATCSLGSQKTLSVGVVR